MISKLTNNNNHHHHIIAPHSCGFLFGIRFLIYIAKLKGDDK